MKNIIKRYYELDDETKELLYSMSLFHELETQIAESDNQDLNNLSDEEKILEIAMTCSYLTTLDGSEIIKRLLQILSCRDISIEDIMELTSEELIEMISNVDDENNEEQEELRVIKKFDYNDLFCVFFKSDDKYLLTYEKNDDVRVLIFNNLEELLSVILNKDLTDSRDGI